MKNRIRKLQSLSVGLLFGLGTLQPVMADDTELFFGSATVNENIRPNVLFILDTSGSMGSMSGNVPGTGKTRSENMKEALQLVLDSAPSINVGLMQFNRNEGGPVLYPVTHIDKILEDTSVATTVVRPVATGADDAVEVGGAVTLDGLDLPLAYEAALTTPVDVEVSVAASNDDAAEKATNSGPGSRGDMYLTNGELTMRDRFLHGFRFAGVNIPQGARIITAGLALRADAGDSNDVTLRFYGENVGNANAFGNSSYNISTRPRTSSFAEYSPSAWSNGSWYTVTGLEGVVQDIVNRGDWNSGNALAIIQTHEDGNQRRAKSFDRSSSDAPTLKISYAAGSVDTPATVGLRFTDVGIPQGAIITSASIEFVAKGNSSGSMGTPLKIKGIREGDVASFTATSTDITGRTSTAEEVEWTPDAWNSGTSYSTPDLSNVVQEIVNQSGWCGNNAMGFTLSGGTAAAVRRAMSYEGDPSLAPRLRVSYDPESAAGCMNHTLVYRVNKNSDDAHEIKGTWSTSVQPSSNIVTVTSDTTAGFRFENLKIRKGATILEATLDLVPSANATGSVTATINAQAANNASTFGTGSSNISNRTRTTASASWNLGAWTAGQSVRSPDIKSVIQEVVNRSGWEPGNALALLVSANGTRSVFAHDGSPIQAAVLRVKVRQDEVAYRTVRTLLKETVDTLGAWGNTPAVEAYYEAINYFRGGPVYYGSDRMDNMYYERLSHPDSWTGGTINRDSRCTEANLNSSYCLGEKIDGDPVYKSPIIDACQANYIVLLTDGEANHNEVETRAKTMMGKSACATASSGEKCARDLAEWSNTADQSSTVEGTQIIKTYTVGFNLDEGGNAGAIQMLKDMANKGGGTYHSASTAQDLANVFTNIIGDILRDDTTFVSPGVAVNQFNRLSHMDQVYFALFKPERSTFWDGNLKRFKLDGESGNLVDREGNTAVDPSTGFFRVTAKSFWADSSVSGGDGGDVRKGGAVGQQSLTDRKVYTYLGVSKDLTNEGNKVHESNADITKALLGAAGESDTYRNEVLMWARGLDRRDVNGNGDRTEVRKQIGDPLHSLPTIVTYGDNEATAKRVIYFGTNDGFLHAIDSDSGKELFSFIPKELLPNLRHYYENLGSMQRPYGLDGPITVYKAKGKTYLVVGMRRGGGNYYALDITSYTAPKLAWTIKSGDTGFEELAQSWSRPIPARVNVNGTPRNTLIFAGGYDPDQDGFASRTMDDSGRAIFMVDAETGARIWAGGNMTAGTNQQKFDNMDYSIPSDVRVLDTDGDGFADRMYVGDMGGQLWRFDINNGATASQLVDAWRMAQLSGEDAENNRRFYYPPDVALIRPRGKTGFLSIAIGSGWREHPLNETTKDRFYMIRDPAIFVRPSPLPDMITETGANNTRKLYDATDNVLGEGSSDQKLAAQGELAAAAGWYIRLTRSGEKVLAPSITVNRQILFTTFQPSAMVPGSCTAGYGVGRFFLVNVADATPVIDRDGDGLKASDREATLARPGIPPAPTLLLPEDGAPVVLVGPEKIDGLNPEFFMKGTFWRQGAEARFTTEPSGEDGTEGEGTGGGDGGGDGGATP